MTLTLDIEHDDTTSTLRILAPDELGDADTPSLQSARIEQQLVRQPDETDTAEVVVYRDAWSDVETDLDRTNDRLAIREDGDPVFGGRLADFERDGVTVSVLIDGPKRDAIDAEPSGKNTLFNTQPDSDILGDVLGRVPTVNAGTVETVDSAIAFSESHASPGKSITKLARDADAEVRYRTTESGFELDYVDRLGEDRTAETLSPESATVLGEPRIREDVIEDVTHVRVLGAGEGTAQTEAEAVAAAYDSADDRPVYRRRVDKDIQQTERAQSLAETLVAEYDGSPEFLEIEFEIPAHVEPSLGDTFGVELPAHDIDTTLRITMLDRIIDAAGDRFRAVLSNRRHTADTGGEERARELDSLSEGNAGQIIRDSDSQGFDKVDDGEPQEWFFDYPSNVIGEFEATLRVESQPFRRPASAQGHSHDFSIDDHNHAVFVTTTSDEVPNSESTEVYFEDGLNTLSQQDGFTQVDGTSISTAGWPYFISGVAAIADGDSTDLNKIEFAVAVDLDGDGSSDLFRTLTNEPQTTDTTPSTSARNTEVITGSRLFSEDLSSASEVALFIRVSGADSVDIVWDYRIDSLPTHTHEVSASETTTAGGSTSSTTDEETALEPGIVTEDTLTPSNVSVDIDGETVISGLDHPIQETVDISGVLSAGANQITASSDTLGELRTSVTFEAVKNVGDTS